MVEMKFKDGFVSLYLNDELKLEQAEVSGVNIGTYTVYEDEEVAKCDYDTALVGKGASFTGIEVYADGLIYVDEGGKLANINITGGTLSGTPICLNASGWYGAGICLSSADYTQNGPGAVLLTGGTFSGCSVNPLNGYTGHGGAIETYGGTLSAQDVFFTGNSANGTGAAGGAMALMYSNNTITGGTFSANKAYFGGAIQQNGGAMTVTGAFFAGNSTEGDPTDTYAPGGGAVEIHNGATASISGCTFSANSSRSGGAIYNDTYDTAKSAATVDGCMFDANTADYQGGAIYNYASMTVTNSVFTGNQVTDSNPYSTTAYGGAVANTQNGAMTITGGTFSANSAVYGGAVATFIPFGGEDPVTADLTVIGAAFSENAASYGGGVYIQTGMTDKTVIADTDFSGNTAGYGGGAVCRCYGAMTITGGTFTANSAGNDGGAVAVWDSWDKDSSISGATFDSNTALYGGAISHSWASVPLLVSGCVFTGNSAVFVSTASDSDASEPAPVPTAQGGAIWNDSFSTGVVTISGSTFSGNMAEQGGAVYNAGNMKLENVVLATASDTVYNSGSLAFAGANTLGAAVVNDGKITFSLSSGTDPLVSDLGAFSGSGTYLVKLSADTATAGAKFAVTAGTYTGSLSVKLDDTASSDVFTLNGGIVGNDLAVVGNTVLRLTETDGALTVKQQVLQALAPAVSKEGSIMAWTDGEYVGGYWVEIAQSESFDNAIRILTDGTAFDVASAKGAYSCRVTEADGTFAADSATWTNSGHVTCQMVSNANGRADVFFAAVSADDVWGGRYQATNTVTGETAEIVGKNRIRDTFTGSNSDANILYLSDTANGDALFMDDIYSEFGEAARISLIREVRAGAGDDVVDMTSERYTSELAGMTVRGGAGDDVVWGAAGGNWLFGDAGNDRIAGGKDNDIIAGGAGEDTLAGGGGADTFAFGGNWGSDVVSQAADGSVILWFETGDFSKWNVSTLTYTDGANTVQVLGVAEGKISLKFGNDGSEQYKALAAAGAFLESTAESVFETAAARTTGILASL